MVLKELRQFDLNSLVVLKVLLEEQHVTRAAEQLNLTQSAVSRTLGRLRDAFSDPLLVNVGKQMHLTPRAEELIVPLNAILQQVESLIAPEVFEPRTHEGRIRLATTDYGTHTLLPRLVPLLADAAPNIELSALEWPSDLLDDLEQNKVDLIIGGTSAPSQDIHQRIVAHDEMKGLVRKGHPFANQMSLDNYLSLNHIIISASGEGLSPIDSLLKELGKERRIAIRVPHFFAALEIISNTDYMILVPGHFTRRYVDTDKFEIIEPPFDIPTLEISMFWHPECIRIHYTNGSVTSFTSRSISVAKIETILEDCPLQ